MIFLLYDFSLNIGDSISNVWGEYSKVVNRKIEELYDGTEIIHLEYSNRSDDAELIGNVENGFLGYYEWFQTGCTSIQLLCLKKDDTLLYERYKNACSKTESLIPSNDSPIESSLQKLVIKNHLEIHLPDGRRFDALGREIK